MRIPGYGAFDVMLDSDATTGTRRGPGAALSAKRMTPRERKALRAAIGARQPERKAATETAAKAAEEATAGFPEEVEALAETVAATEAEAKAATEEAEAALNLGAGYQRLAEIYGKQAAEAEGDFGDGEGDGEQPDVNAILAEFYARIQADAAAQRRAAGESAYNLLFEEFSRYGLGSLVEPLRGFIEEGLSPAEFTIRLRNTDTYKKRFAANAQRIAKGLRALSEAEYIELEDQYQNVMRTYGLPPSYYERGELGRQQGFEKFIAGDVSAAELEDRIQTAQDRVINAAPQVGQALRQFYPDITNGDILAYALDPDQALTNIRRKVTAAEIGGAAIAQGLATGVTRAEELGRYGVTAQQAREGFQTIAGVLPRATTLSQIYGKQGMGPYTQTTAEQEVFGLAGAAESERQRRKLTELEQASFAGSSGMAGGALSRERAGSI